MYVHIPQQQQASKNAKKLSEQLVEVIRAAKKSNKKLLKKPKKSKNCLPKRVGLTKVADLLLLCSNYSKCKYEIKLDMKW